jgi:hypothetical protein
MGPGHGCSRGFGSEVGKKFIAVGIWQVPQKLTVSLQSEKVMPKRRKQLGDLPYGLADVIEPFWIGLAKCAR